MVEVQVFREAMSRLGAAVNVITTTGVEGHAGFTASAVCSVTDSPPTLLVCMNRNSRQHDTFVGNGRLCVNVLAPAHQELSGIFAGMTGAEMAERFAQAKWTELATGSPVLEGAVTAFDCIIANVAEVGTHSVLFCEVQAIALGHECNGLIYFGRDYHHVRREPLPAVPRAIVWDEAA